ncbi:hypothetical protein BJF78_26265 [Pseudonocardia sp. CNS-139]|nr:hypothetical protein BJF78_26265 [Pseudonocardia sp. CNS-139]
MGARVHAAAHRPDTDRATRRVRTAGWAGAGLVVWVLSGWPVAGIAVGVVGLWAPWLLGSARAVHERIDRLEALEMWCRRMADILAGGGTVGLTQAITTSAGTAAERGDERIAAAVATLARRLREGRPVDQAMSEFADLVDDRVATPSPPPCGWRYTSSQAVSRSYCASSPTGSPATSESDDGSKPNAPSRASRSGCCCSSRPGSSR